ncbi:MAG: OmpA family protein [Bacteroidota bacterium]
MSRLSIILTIALLILISLSSTAQIREAEKEMALYNYSGAIRLLEKIDLHSHLANALKISTLLAECYRKQNDIPHSIEWFKKAIGYGSVNPEHYYFYAMALKSSGEYQTAKRYFFKADSLSGNQHSFLKFVAFCDSAISWHSYPEKYTVRNMKEVNTPQAEFGPFWSGDTLFFCSDRILKSESPRYGWTGNEFLRIFTATPANHDSVSERFKPARISPMFIQSDGHTGPLIFNNTGTDAFLTRSLIKDDKGKREKNRLRTHLLKIFTIHKRDGRWSSPEPFFLNNENFSVGHPALSTGGDTLIFASDMPNGHGGTDLYMCRRTGSGWSDPVNLGDGINTEANEMFPSFSPKGDLLFSSEGLPGFGGLDLFICKREKGAWLHPENLGTPLNSSYDDFSMVYLPAGTSGFFSSNRPSGVGNDDLWFFSAKILSPPTIFLAGCVKEKGTLVPLPLSWVFILDNLSAEVKVIQTDSSGCFRTMVERGRSYVIKAMQKKHKDDCLTFFTSLSEKRNEIRIPRDLLLEKLETGKTYSIRNIYYDFDLWNIRPDAQPPLDEVVALMKSNTMKIELASHTDCRGAESYNFRLSQKRAESAVRYMIEKGIDSARIVARGYGKSRLLNRCNCENNQHCTESEHQANRRTEFTILGYTDAPDENSINFSRFKSGTTLKTDQFEPGFFRICK